MGDYIAVLTKPDAWRYIFAEKKINTVLLSYKTPIAWGERSMDANDQCKFAFEKTLMIENWEVSFRDDFTTILSNGH